MKKSQHPAPEQALSKRHPAMSLARGRPLSGVLAVVAVAAVASVLIVAYGRPRLAGPAALEQSRAKWYDMPLCARSGECAVRAAGRLLVLAPPRSAYTTPLRAGLFSLPSVSLAFRCPRRSKLMGTNSVFLPKLKKHDLKAAVTALRAEGPARPTKLTAARFQELSELPECCEPTKVPVEDVYEEYNMCQSCLHDCKMFEEEKCGFDVLKEQCLPDVLMEGCAECEGKGCSQVIEFLNENEALNATAEGGDNITRLEIFTELVWDHAQEEAVCVPACPSFGHVRTARAAAQPVRLAGVGEGRICGCARARCATDMPTRCHAMSLHAHARARTLVRPIARGTTSVCTSELPHTFGDLSPRACAGEEPSRPEGVHQQGRHCR